MDWSKAGHLIVGGGPELRPFVASCVPSGVCRVQGSERQGTERGELGVDLTFAAQYLVSERCLLLFESLGHLCKAVLPGAAGDVFSMQYHRAHPLFT